MGNIVKKNFLKSKFYIPACAVSGVSYVCGQTPSATPPVGIDLTTLAKGDVLGIYDYAVLVTQVSKGSSPFTGKGLVKLPFAGGIKVPVEFKGIKAKKGEEGTHGGCVWYVPSDLNEGYFQIKGSKQDAIVKEQEKLLADIYSELIDPQSFYGTFEEALAKYEAKSREIACKLGQLPADQCVGIPAGQPTKDDYKELTKNLRGVVQGGTDWKDKLLKHLGADASKPEMKAIIESLDKIKADLLACEKCVTDTYIKNPPTPAGKGGPAFFDFERFVMVDCQMVLGTEQKMSDIGDLMKLLLGKEKSGDIQLKLLAAIKEARSVKKAVLDLAPIIKGGIQSSWIPNTEKLDNLNHKMYPPVTNLKLPNGKILKYLQVDADDAIWKKDQTTIPFQAGVIGLNYTERKVTKAGYTALMFKDAANVNSIFWVTVKDEDVATMKEYWEGPKFPVSGEQLHLIFPKTELKKCEDIAKLINKYSDKFKINTPLRMAHFLGQIGTETGGLVKTKEGTNHRESVVKSLFGNTLRPDDNDYRKYCGLFEGYDSPLDKCETISYTNSKGKKITVETLPHCTPELLASVKLSDLNVKENYYWKGHKTDPSPTLHLDYAYACRMGNGPPSTHDGSTFAGKGFIHLTGKGQYKKISDLWNNDTDNSTNKKYFDGADIDELVNNLDIAMKASLYYWQDNDLNDLADDGTSDEQIDKVGGVVNGGNPPNNYEDRRTHTNDAYTILTKK